MTPFSRRLLRTIFTLPLLLCLLGWILSGWYQARISYLSTSYGLAGGTVSGTLFLVAGSVRGYPPTGFEYYVTPAPVLAWWPQPDHIYHRFLGFLYQNPTTPDTNIHILGIPYYFPLLLSSLALLYIFRKTRPTLSAATAFPVETTRN